ncbi:tyrosinase central domain protein [Mycena galericulata]|nr:tyrosinase central domain protein [Mycena galericulata]
MFLKTVVVSGVCALLSIRGSFALPSENSESAVQTSATCTPETIALRQEWGSMTDPQRTAYIDAVLCLMSLPSIFSPGEVPGAKSHFDDFIAVHINQTLNIHISGIFLPWHREFVHLYEQALQQKCGYKGTQPYWNWPLWASDLIGSPLFNGGPTSLSGDGAYNASQGPYPIAEGVYLPRGTGGGCVLGGPFVNHTINFGPFNTNEAFEGILPANWQAYTPHCFVRDLNNYVASLYGNDGVVAALLGAETMAEFQGNMTGFPATLAGLGPHPGYHIALGFSLQDFFASPGDPAFYFHHGMVDRTWTLWQAMDPKKRQTALNGTESLGNPPTSPTVTLDTVINWGPLGKAKAVGNLMNTLSGEYCYRYV